MVAVLGSIDIDRPVDEVFDFVADQRNEPSYNPRMTSSEKLTDGPIGAGTRFRAVMQMRGRSLPMEIEFTDLDRPHRLASRTTGAGSQVVGQLTFQPVGRGTRMTWDWDVRFGGPMRWLSPIVAWIGRRQEREIWTGLKHLLEHDPGH